MRRATSVSVTTFLSRCARAGGRLCSPSATNILTGSRELVQGVRHLVLLAGGMGKKQRQALPRATWQLFLRTRPRRSRDRQVHR